VLLARREPGSSPCGGYHDKQFRDVVDAALAGGCRCWRYRGRRDRGRASHHGVAAGAALVQLTRRVLKGPQIVVKRVARSDRRGGRLVVLSPILACLPSSSRVDLESRFLHAGARGRGGGLQDLQLRTMVDGAEAKRESYCRRA